MQHIDPATPAIRLPLHGAAASRAVEQLGLSKLPAHELMRKAAHAVTRLACALYPHARRVWVACGPGNNGGDGLLAAAELHRRLQDKGGRVAVSWSGNEHQLPVDARFALAQARAAGVHFAAGPPAHFDLAIDALLGLGAKAQIAVPLSTWSQTLQQTTAPVLCIDLPSGLDPDTGQWPLAGQPPPKGPRHTLSLLTLKPGLFTAHGRDAAGDIWWDTLGVDVQAVPPDAWLLAHVPTATPRQTRHGAHKGSHGDLLVLGGQDQAVKGQGMTGAALLAARAGLLAGAGRVYVGLLGREGVTPATRFDPQMPELMFRNVDELVAAPMLNQATTVCGCGGGTAVQAVLPALLAHSPRLILDADALNAIAANANWQDALSGRLARGYLTVLTPHPLEAGRLLGQTSGQIQADRLLAASELARRFQSIVVLKGSGSVLASPDSATPMLCGSGNALLATAGTGDVLAGAIGAYLAQTLSSPDTSQDSATLVAAAFELTCQAVQQHGLIANLWPQGKTLVASELAWQLTPP